MKETERINLENEAIRAESSSLHAVYAESPRKKVLEAYAAKKASIAESEEFVDYFSKLD